MKITSTIDIVAKVEFFQYHFGEFIFTCDQIICKNSKDVIADGCQGMVAMCENVHKLAFPNIRRSYAHLQISSEPFENSISVNFQSNDGSIEFPDFPEPGKVGLGLAQGDILQYFQSKGHTKAYIGLKNVDTQA